MEGPAPSAALPRALDVQRFAGAREQEIRALCTALQEGPLGDKFGVAALPRHLRRRAGSHKPFHGHRFRPNLKLQGKRRKVATDRQEGVPQGAGSAPDAPAAAAAEEEAEGQRHPLAPASAAARPFTNRRMRRQPAALAEQHRHSAAWTEASLKASAVAAAPQGKDAPSSAAGGASPGSSSTGSPLRRLETHVWHAKRLAMEERYGWLLPAGAAGQGRGSRSFVHLAHASCLMHDASYLCPLLLRGPWRRVYSLLSSMLSPEDAAALEADWQAGSSSGGGNSAGVSSVAWEQEVMLHHPARYPAGAICPVQLLLARCSGRSDGGSFGGKGGASSDAEEPMELDAPGSSAAGAMAEAAAAEVVAPEAAEAGVQACLWVHPAAAAEAQSALQLAASQQGADADGGSSGRGVSGSDSGSSGSSVSIAVLDIRRLELRGGRADTALAVALAGTTAGSSQQSKQQAQQPLVPSRQQQPPQPLQQQTQAQAQAGAPDEPGPQLPLPDPLAGMQHGEAAQVLLPDPRLRKPVALGSAAASLLPEPAAAAAAAAAAGEAELSGQARVGQVVGLEQQPWDLRRLQHAPLPLSEAELSARRQQLRRCMLQLGTATAVSVSTRGNGGDGGASGSGGRKQGGAAEVEGEGELRRRGYCPAVLVRHDPPGDGAIPGWSLILPSGWVPPLWLAAAYAGSKPAGQREWRWLHALQQRSFFPWDHPDTAGYAALVQQQQGLRAAAAAKQPKGKRMLAAPPPPPTWQLLQPSAEQTVQEKVAAAASELVATTDVLQAVGAAPPPQVVQQMQDGEEQQQQAMAVDSSLLQASAGAAAEAAAAAGLTEAAASQAGASLSFYVARTYAAMVSALRGSSSLSGGSASVPMPGSRLVAAALRQGLLEWRPRRQQGPSSQAAAAAAPAAEVPPPSSTATPSHGRVLCLLEATVQPLKTGVPAEGGAVCVVAGWEAQRCRQPLQVLGARRLRWRQKELEEQRAALAEAGGDPDEVMGAALVGSGASSGGSGSLEVGEGDVQAIGYVLSEAPRGAPRRCGALAAVGAADAWRLRSLQHYGPALGGGGGGGGIQAFVRNPGSSALFPVQLQLAVERAA